MEIKYRLDRDNLYIYSYGELDEYTAGNARRDIDKIIDENAFCKSVIFDFANLFSRWDFLRCEIFSSKINGICSPYIYEMYTVDEYISYYVTVIQK